MSCHWEPLNCSCVFPACSLSPDCAYDIASSCCQALDWPSWRHALLVQVMIDHEQKKLRLIDWGLAEFYHPGKEYAPPPSPFNACDIGTHWNQQMRLKRHAFQPSVPQRKACNMSLWGHGPCKCLLSQYVLCIRTCLGILCLFCLGALLFLCRGENVQKR